jgi:hypothetical protein
MENFFWISISALWVEIRWLFSEPISVRSSAMVISRSPFGGPVRGKTVSGSRLRTSCLKRATL